jgi:type IV fimbrial biogenesis protein FimT
MNAGRAHRGVTLIELLFALGLLALLAGLAAPGFQSSLRAAAMRSATFGLLAGLQQARAHSILESRAGLLCPTDPAGQCLAPAMTGTAWRSFLEQGSARQELAGQELPPGMTLRASRSPLRFWPSSHAASTGTLTICVTRGLAAPRAIVISQTGRARLGEAAAGACRA